MANIGMLGWLQAGASLLQVFGGFKAAAGARAEGESARAWADWKAKQEEQSAGTAIAIAQRHAEEARRQSRYVASRALAVLAASGGGASDPGAVRILANADAEGAYAAQVAIYEGEERARALRAEAAATRAGGINADIAARGRATGYLMGGATRAIGGYVSLREKYGGGGPSGDAKLIDEPGQYTGYPWGGT